MKLKNWNNENLEMMFLIVFFLMIKFKIVVSDKIRMNDEVRLDVKCKF